jgi:hypothetical protein
MNVGRSHTCRFWTADSNSQMPCHGHTALCRGLEKSLSEWHGLSMARVNHSRSHCVNQMGKTLSKSLAARNGMGTAWVRHGVCELALNGPTRAPYKQLELNRSYT